MMLFAHDSRELTKALAVYGAAAPAGGTAGVFLGGVITEWISWPWVFYVNIPIALAVLVAIPALLPRATGARGSIDVAGAATVTAGLALAVFGIVRAPEAGWTSPTTILALVGALALLAAFGVVQRRQAQPLMRLDIFRTPNLAAANAVQLLLGAAWIPMWFFLNLYLQQVLGFGAFAGGAALLPMTVAIMALMIVVAPRIIARYGTKAPIVAGLWLLALGLAALSLARPDGNFAVDVLPASLVAAAGMALAFIPSLGTAISSAPPQDGGLAAGIVNTSYQVGSALGLAAMTAVASAWGADRLDDPASLTAGFGAAFLGAAAIAAAAGVLAHRTLRRPEEAPVEEVETPARAAA
jgi:MFS family permease